MIKLFENKTEYDATVKPTDESRVGLIEDINQSVVDGVNVHVKYPKVGDLVFENGDDEVVFIDYLTAVRSLIPSTYTHVGYILEVMGDSVKIIHDLGTTAQWLDCWQYAITAIASTDITIRLRMSNDYSSNTSVAVTLSSTDINATTAQEISDAVSAKATEVGDTNPWWAWYDEDNERIIVQTDTCVDYQQNAVGGVNCTISLCVWEDMPASGNLWRTSGVSTNYCMCNPAKFISYYSTHGTTPTADIPLHSATIVTEAGFENSEFCQLLRDAYGDYSTYMIAEHSGLIPSKYGVFGLLSGEEMTKMYGNSNAPTKDGDTMYKFPALHQCATLDFEVEGLESGDWHLATPEETLIEMSTDVFAALRISATKVGETYPDNSVSRWTSARSSAYRAWLFSGTIGFLFSNLNVPNAYRVMAVTLYKIS